MTYNYKKVLSEQVNNEMKAKLGNIDKSVFETQNAEILYYLFPLIERSVVEILRLFCFTDIEYYEQGKIRTLNSILDKNIKTAKLIFEKETILLLKKYFSENGLRNQIMHFNSEYEKISVQIVELEEIKDLVCILLITYKKALEFVENLPSTKIEHIK